MSYEVVEAAILTTLRLNASYNTANSARGDWRQLGKPADRMVTLSFGGFERKEISLKLEQHIWLTHWDLYVPWKGDVAAYATLWTAERQRVIDHMATKPRLGGAAGVTRAGFLAGDEPEPLPPAGVWAGNRLVFETRETVDPGRTE